MQSEAGMNPRTIAVLLFFSSSVCVACSSEPVGASTTDVTTAIDVAHVGCPDVVPNDETDCAKPGLECSYGTDPRWGCRMQAVCGDDLGRQKWKVVEPSCPRLVTTCPEKEPHGDGAKCGDDTLGLTCLYGENAYTCTPCEGTLCFQKNTWKMQTLDEGCPTDAVPNLGDACTTPHLFCNYNVCADDQIPPNQWAYGIAMKCDRELWQFDGGNEVCL